MIQNMTKLRLYTRFISQKEAMKNRLQHIGLIVWLLIYMPFAQTAFGQVVLCLGADGHIALENTGANEVCNDQAYLASVLDQDWLTVDHCGVCLDLLPNLDNLNFSRQDMSFVLVSSLVVDVSPVLMSPTYSLHTLPVSSQKQLHVSVPTTVLQI